MNLKFHLLLAVLGKDIVLFLYMLNNWYRCLDQSQTVVAVLMDLNKAFNFLTMIFILQKCIAMVYSTMLWSIARDGIYRSVYLKALFSDLCSWIYIWMTCCSITVTFVIMQTITLFMYLEDMSLNYSRHWEFSHNKPQLNAENCKLIVFGKI